MAIQYTTSINDTDKDKVLLLIDASLQAYNAFNKHKPEVCQTEKVIAPTGYELVDSWLGIDAVFHHDKTVECYGVVFRSVQAPYTYIFAFRGTDSVLDIIDDLGVESTSFKAFDATVAIPDHVKVESGFFNVYCESSGSTASMQQELFKLIDKYQASDKPITQLFITGHSLGAAISEIFTLDVALSRSSIQASSINYACPRVGNQSFVNFYEQQPAQREEKNKTLRVQNTYDKVPCVPLEKMGYQHTSNAYLIAFHKDGWLGKLNFIDSHSSNNYSAVLNCAAESASGICEEKALFVAANDYSVTSEKPIKSDVCNYW